MGSPYASSGGSGGSAYAQPGSSTGSAYAGGGSSSPSKKKGGGILGRAESGAHWVAAKSALAGHDLKTIPGGTVHAALTVVNASRGNDHGQLKQLGHDYVSQAKDVLHHPLRDPFLTAVTLLPFFKVLGGVGLRGVAASRAAQAGDGAAAVVKAAARKPVAGHGGVLGPRLIRQGDAQIPLHASKNPAVRLVQHGYDKVIQHALDTNPDSRLGAHAAKRVGGSIDETRRYRVGMREAPAGLVEHGGVKLGPRKASPLRAVTSRVPRKVQEAALRLTSENSTAEEAAAFHRAQAEAGVNPKGNLKQAALYDRVVHHGLLTQDEHGNVVVNAEAHPKLAAVDALVAHGQDQVDKIAQDFKLMTDEQLTARRNGPARIRAGGTFEAPTPGKLGVPSQALIKARSDVARLQALHDRATERASAAASAQAAREPGAAALGSDIVGPGKVVGAAGAARAAKIGAALSVAKERLASIESAAAKRVKPTGVVGGETARPGRGFVSYRTQEPRAPKSRVASAAGPVVGKVRSFIPKKQITYKGLQAGKVPDNTTRLVAQHMRDAYRYVSSSEARSDAYETGSPTKRSSRDVLVLNPEAETAGRITPGLDELLGRKGSTLDQLPAEELDAVRHGFEGFRQQLVPGLTDHFARDKSIDIGEEAPEGYRFVDRATLGELGRPTRVPLTGIGHAADKLNTAVTAATVYFKLGHVGTRVFTNAATNIIQGSATPVQVADSWELWHALTPLERAKALAASGQHSFHALPLSDGTGRVSRAISATGRAGANWWAKHADVPFRFNSIAYEARKAGFDTPEKFRDLLDKLENPHAHNMNAAEAAKVDWVAKRANREGIAYDRLNDFERRFITRAFWFYPWTAGATRFLGNTLLEHPYKSAVGGNLGAQGRQTQQAELGDLPSYEAGLFKVGGSAASPLVADFSTFSPVATPADVADVPEFSGVGEFLNPAYAAALQIALRQNQYGEHTNKPLGDALSSLFAPTPEAQILNAYLHPPKPTQMFHKTPLNMLARAAAGPGTPRKLNPSAAHKAAARERAGR